MRINLRNAIAKKFGAKVNRVRCSAGAAILAGGLAFAGTAEAQNQLLDWEMDPTTTPVGGPVEFFGWTFMDKDSWNATSGQGRSDFTLGQGTVAVADGDEYDDDAGNGAVLGNSSQAMNVFLMTPDLSFGAGDPTTAQLDFDSSFFPYDAQTGVVDVSFDGGSSWNNLLTIDSVVEGNSSAARKDEAINLNLGAQAGDTSAQIRFGYLNGDNDWWWAVDNIEVTAGASTLLAEDFEGIALGPFVSSSESGGDGTDWANIQSAQAPEPGSLAMAGIALATAAAGGLLRRNRKDN